MPRKDWLIWLDHSCRIECERITQGGKVVAFRLVLLADIGGGTHCVTRYDTSHGFAHQDILAFGGLVREKIPMREDDFTLAFQAAYHDLVTNHECHLREYLKRR
jgi:hypothetical protein